MLVAVNVALGGITILSMGLLLHGVRLEMATEPAAKDFVARFRHCLSGSGERPVKPPTHRIASHRRCTRSGDAGN